MHISHFCFCIILRYFFVVSHDFFTFLFSVLDDQFRVILDTGSSNFAIASAPFENVSSYFKTGRWEMSRERSVCSCVCVCVCVCVCTRSRACACVSMAFKSTFWHHLMHVDEVWPVTSYDQCHCPNLYVLVHAPVCTCMSVYMWYPIAVHCPIAVHGPISGPKDL